jgi:hypothetical protein
MGIYSLTWYRWSAYEQHAERWIHPAISADKDEYSPVEHVEQIVSALAKVGRTGTAQSNLEALQQFYAAFGFLGQTALQTEEGYRVVEVGNKRYLMSGDQWPWALDHAHNVGLCLAFLRALQARDYDRLRSLFRDLGPERERFVPGLPLHVPTGDKSITVNVPRGAFEMKRNELEATARVFVARLLNPNLGAVDRIYDAALGQSVFRFKSLLSLIYWRLADASAAEDLSECHECGAVFFADDAREVYCPPPPGVRESRCGRRFRMRRARVQSSSSRGRRNARGKQRRHSQVKVARRPRA